MLDMRRPLIAIGTSVALTLGLPATALALITEVGATTDKTLPSCPGNPCLAVSRTTGFQAKMGALRVPAAIPRPGRIVAWTITLGKPTAKQIQFFNTNEGGPASAGISVLRGGSALNYTLIGSSPAIPLQPYFGLTAQFPLDTSIPVKKGDLVALNVPTWAPALALGFQNNTSWRASRLRSKCSDTTTQSVHTRTGSVVQYICLYRTARLTYSATLISTP